MNLSDAERLFHEALTQVSPEARASFLDAACAGDPALRERVQRLLEAHEQTVSLLPVDPLRSGLALAPAEEAGSVIGRYKLLQRIGEGGMGVVYMAQQEEPVRRRVALKIIKLGMDTRAVVARFEAERQALAMMDHPNIARVFDGGATGAGRPYFVMELVQGVPITEYCDRNKLPASERLRLFLAVCQAIQSAHQKGVIHRDIKPSNVLVTLEHGEPMPKVIDFGIAKATNQKLTEKTLFTNYATMIGTPAYMSPEQAEMTSLDVDTRADIYSLGVLLYELLTGTTPFPAERLRSLGYGEMQRVIVEEEPERPSTRLGTLTAEQRTTVARNRGHEFQALGALLRGDLDWIVMRCLEKDRRRRYDTANALAADLQRHLGNEPVEARPPSSVYRFKKWVRRNRAATITVGAVTLALISAALVSSLAFVRERAARLAAMHAEAAREAARQTAESEAVRADTLGLFLEHLLDRVTPELAARGHYGAIWGVLSVADEVAVTLTNAPAAEAAIRFRLGMHYINLLSDYAHAEGQFARMGRLSPRLGARAGHSARLARALEVVARMGRTLNPEEALELRRLGAAALSCTPPDTETAAYAMSFAALFLFHFRAANPAEAERLATEVIRFAPDDTVHASPRTTALLIAAQSALRRGATVEADGFADQLLESIDWSKSMPNAESIYAYATVQVSIRSPKEAEARIRELLDTRAASTSGARVRLSAQLGAVIALSGQWRAAVPIVYESCTNAASTVEEWQLAVSVLGLAGESELRDRAFLLGIARFAGGSDPETCRGLAGSLVHGPVDAARLPLLREMLERAKEGPAWSQVWTLLPSGMLEYRVGQYAKALQIAEEFRKQTLSLGLGRMEDNEPALAAGWFLTACAESRLHHPDAARAAYLEGRRLMPEAAMREGQPSAYKYFGTWQAASDAELLRREAVQLMGGVPPGDQSGPE